ncbi:MAG: acyl-CoA dehydratase activase [Desulfobacterota bacterium]|nr:acyl-CoA dehydratase activase [Thermodesulfobacteriota bacterium]
MGIALGIDIGSAVSKGVALHPEGLLSSFDCPSGGHLRSTAEKVRTALLERAGIAATQNLRTVATGYGAKQVYYADEVRPEVACLAKGISSLLPSVRTVIDIGDLYTKVLHTDGKGGVTNFVLSGKCAGGSGRILQVMAKVLQVKVEEIGELSLKSTRRVEFNTGCAVFAESEAISRLSQETKKEDLLAGLHRALAAQIQSLAERIGIEKDVALTGGGALDIGLVAAFRELWGEAILVPANPNLVAALGAALFAREGLGPSIESL